MPPPDHELQHDQASAVPSVIKLIYSNTEDSSQTSVS
jgi:hypothetical protein